VFKTGGTHGPNSLVFSYISHIKSDVRLPDSQDRREVETSEWVVIADWGSPKLFCEGGDSGDSVITAELPYTDIGRIIGGSDDGKFCYISDTEMTLKDIQEELKADSIRLAK